MRLRRILNDGRLHVQRLGQDGLWEPWDEDDALGGTVFDLQWQLLRAREHLRDSQCLTPFFPLSFRDFLLFERHNIDATRGLVSRFHPMQYRAASAFEWLAGRTFPLYRPRPLFRRQPLYYMANHVTFIPSGTPVAAPAYTRALDYELEIGFVLSEPLFDASPAEAVNAIGSFVVINDLSARDIQRSEMQSLFGPQKAKHFASSMSETAVTADEILPQINQLTGSVAINGKTVSSVSSTEMAWSIGEVLAHASRSEQLLPGELLATGTLPGGSGMEIGRWLQPGDQLTLTIDQIGQIEHRITAA